MIALFELIENETGPLRVIINKHKKVTRPPRITLEAGGVEIFQNKPGCCFGKGLLTGGRQGGTDHQRTTKGR
jgi:hypothetical protein